MPVSFSTFNEIYLVGHRPEQWPRDTLATMAEFIATTIPTVS